MVVGGEVEKDRQASGGVITSWPCQVTDTRGGAGMGSREE
jgi:hypothetical protein